MVVKKVYLFDMTSGIKLNIKKSLVNELFVLYMLEVSTVSLSHGTSEMGGCNLFKKGIVALLKKIISYIYLFVHFLIIHNKEI